MGNELAYKTSMYLNDMSTLAIRINQHYHVR